MREKLEALVKASKWWWIYYSVAAFVATKWILGWTITQMGGAEPPDLWFKTYTTDDVTMFMANVDAAGYAAYYTLGRYVDWIFPFTYWAMLSAIIVFVCKRTGWRKPLGALVAPLIAAMLDLIENYSLQFDDGSLAGAGLTAMKFNFIMMSFALTASFIVAAISSRVLDKLL